MSKTMKKLLLVVILSIFFIFSLGSDENEYPTDIDCPDALKRFTDSALMVSTKLLKSYANSPTFQTGAVSAMLILLNLIGIGLGARGVTKNETTTTLNLATTKEMKCVANIVNNETFNLPDCIEFSPARNFFANKRFPFTSSFKRIMNNVVVGKATNVDFSDPINASNKINSQVASQTGNRITNIIEDSSIFDNSTENTSITAIFMTGTWQIGMKRTDQVTKFRVSPSKSETQSFMYQDATYLYGHSDILKAQVVQVNFCCKAFYMWEILPDKPFTEDDLIDKMAQNIDWYYELLKKMKPTRLELHLPIYNRSNTVDIKALFQEATVVQSIYDNQSINVTGAIKGDIPAEESVGVQTLYLVTGTEGGPVPKGPQSQKPKKTVKVNYPHVWIVFRNGRAHFIGVTK